MYFLTLYILLLSQLNYAGDFIGILEEKIEFSNILPAPSEELWPVTSNYREKLTKPLVVFVHPYTLCWGASGTKNKLNSCTQDIAIYSNKLLWAAKQLDYDIIYMSGGVDSGGINAVHFPVKPLASLHSEDEKYSPIKANIETNQIILIGGHHGGCVTVATREIIENYFKKNNKPLHIFYPLKGVVRANDKQSTDEIVEHIKIWWENGLTEFPKSPFLCVHNERFRKESSLFIYTKNSLQTYGNGDVEIHFHVGNL